MRSAEQLTPAAAEQASEPAGRGVKSGNRQGGKVRLSAIVDTQLEMDKKDFILDTCLSVQFMMKCLAGEEKD